MNDMNLTSEPVDFSRIQETSDGDQEFESELFGVFLEDCEMRLAQLRAALETGDVDRACREAHTIKGAGSNVGTTHLHAIAADLEKLDGGEFAERGGPLLQALETEYGRVATAIRRYLDAG